MDRAGYAAVQTLANTDPSWWIGGGGTDGFKAARTAVAALFGDEGRRWWDDLEQTITNPDYDMMDASERAEAQEARERFLGAAERLRGGGGEDASGPSRDAQVALKRIVETPAASNPGFRILAAWVREVEPTGAEGEYVAYSSEPQYISYAYEADRVFPGRITGRSDTFDVRVYAQPMGKPPGREAKPLRAYVAVWGSRSAGGSTGSGLGIALLILGPLAVGAVGGMIAGAHTKGVRDLAREIDRLGTHGDATRTVRAHGQEASQLARSVERMVGNLEFRSQHGDEDLEGIVDRERKVAEEIHGALMSKNPPRLSDYEVETLFKPGFEIGGDHFEYFQIDEDHVGVILLDTNVRGIQAALVMGAARAYVRSAAPGVLSPAEVLKTVNRNLAGDLPPGRHVTALYVVIDRREGKATLASAGHLPLLVYRHAGGTMAKVNPEGIALGLDVGPVFDRALQEGDIPIHVGDRIVLYTDGALRIANEEGEEFGEQRFYGTVSREAPKNSLAFVNFVGSAIDQFHLNAPQNDDITISTVKRLR
jgi:serine phosphatase RsbU (regulator of sigma subunit)